MNTLPAIHIYPGDYLRSPLAGCSLAAQGLYWRLRFLMHDSERYGYLCQNGLPIPCEQAARRCGCTLDEFQACLIELESVGEFCRTQDSILYCPSMLRDADKRAKAAERKQKEREKKSQGSHADVTPMSRDSHVEVTPPFHVQCHKENGAKAPNIWSFGVEVLTQQGETEKNIRGLLKKKINEYGEDTVLDALVKTAKSPRAENKSYFLGILDKSRKLGAGRKMVL